MSEKQVAVNAPQDYTHVNESIYGEETIQLKDFILGAFVGGIVGAAAALLLAPKAGSELRSDVAIQAVTLKEKSVEFSGSAKEKTSQISNQLKEQSTNLVEKVKAKTAKQPPALDDGTVSFEGEEPLESIKDAVDQVITEVTEGISEVANSTRHTSIE